MGPGRPYAELKKGTMTAGLGRGAVLVDAQSERSYYTYSMSLTNVSYRGTFG